MGDYGGLTGHQVFAAAKKDAESWTDQVESGGVRRPEIVTVADACRAYLQEKPGAIAEGVFRQQVFSDPIAKVKLDKLRRHHLKEWRKRLEETPALISRSKNGERRTKPRSASTVNRDMVPLRAALGRFLSPGTPNTSAAWQQALKPAKGAGKRRTLYLDGDECRRLLESTEREAGPLVDALRRLPLRPGAMAALKVSDFDSRTRTLTIGKDKSGNPRQITVPQETANFLQLQCKGKPPAAHIFTRRSGKQWNKDAWKHPIKSAATAAKLPSNVSAYTLRHSVITDLVRCGLPILTVAQLADTSVAMIEKHYGHLVRHDAERALAALAL